MGVEVAADKDGEQGVLRGGAVGEDGVGEKDAEDEAVFTGGDEHAETVEGVGELLFFVEERETGDGGVAYGLEEGEVEGGVELGLGVSGEGEDDVGVFFSVDVPEVLG